ncbi:hypothetical protein PoB_003180000 [Plakobranchus ocellatus]|uniref:Uncharacterized protein n=1 Tax=Plakobranchus ocellatus TaxID=259542 RepID=A0AAV4AEV6_9GAST|nr:hypothetical protein PoB_003180000 [Plakobranchus ocellatus]
MPVIHKSKYQWQHRLNTIMRGQAAGGGARTRIRRVPVDLRANSLATVPSTPWKRGGGGVRRRRRRRRKKKN